MAVFGNGALGRSGLGLLSLLLGLSFSARASAFCRTRTCSNDDAAHGADCQQDANGCIISGEALYWQGASFSFWVDARGSAKRNISGTQALETFREALGTWTQADCQPGSPSIAISELTLVSDEAALQQGLGVPDEDPIPVADKNSSVLSFVDGSWAPRDSMAIALTTVTFGPKTGHIFSADVEINSEQIDLTTSDTGGEYDLQSVLTHESGHVFGLADIFQPPPAPTPRPTMYWQYEGNGNLDRRSLQADDMAGICAIYPPDRFAKHGGCGCRTAPAAGEPTSTYWLSAVAIFGWIARRKARNPRPLSRVVR